jgi:hypothetical protein
MAMSGLDVIVKFISDTTSVTEGMTKVEGAGNKLKSMAVGLGAALGGAFAVHEIHDFISTAEEAQAATARLGQTMQNAGDSTGEWAKRAEDLALTLAKKTGIDKEQIEAGQGIIATFHQVGGTAGEIGGAFDRTTQAALDLSRAGFGDVVGASKALGKALQDPEHGLTALRRAGVVFTQAQKDQVKAMVASGDQLGAMNLILGQVSANVGGVAEKTATAGEKMAVSWKETKVSLGEALLPVLNALLPVLQAMAGFVQENATWLVPLAAAIAAVVLVMKAWAIIQAIIDAELLANPVFLIAAALVLLVVIIALVVSHFQIFADAATAAFNWVLGIVQTVWHWIADNWPLLLAILAGPIGIAVLLIVDNWNTIVKALDAAIQFMVGLWNSFVAFLYGIPGAIWNALKGTTNLIIGIFAAAWNWVFDSINNVVSWFIGLPGRILGALGSLAGSMYNAGRNAMDHFLSGLESLMGHIAGRVASFVGDMLSKLNPFGSPQTVAYYKGQAVMRDYVAGAQSMLGPSVEAFHRIGTQAAGATGPTGNAGVSNFNINISVEAGVSPAEVGAVVIDRIRAYERLAGTAWRQS